MGRDSKDHEGDKDGIAKNIDKLNKEADAMIAAVKGAGKSHDPLMNAATEAARASPYGFAHLAVFVVVILTIAVVLVALV